METSIPSFLLAEPSRDLVASARQESTRAWWRHDHSRFTVFISDTVINAFERSAVAGCAAQFIFDKPGNSTMKQLIARVVEKEAPVSPETRIIHTAEHRWVGINPHECSA